MDNRVCRKYFYQKWRGHAPKNNTRREIVFLLLGAPRYALGFGNLLRLTFIRVNSVMDDDAIIGLFMDKEMSRFVKFATVFPSGEMLVDLNLRQIIPVVDNDLSSLVAYLDLSSVFHDVGVDLAAAGPDPMSAPEAFCLKLLWPEYIGSDEKYVAIVIAGILTTRWDLDQNSLSLPPYSMHLTEVGMHLKSLEAVDASLAWALPALKNEGLRLARFLGKSDTERYFSVTESPCHHSDKVVSLNVSRIWKDAERLWSMHDIGLYLREGEHLSGRGAIQSVDRIEEHMDHVTRLCAEAALSEDAESDAPTKFAMGERCVMPTMCVRRPVGFLGGDAVSMAAARSEGKCSGTRVNWSEMTRPVQLPHARKRSPLGDLAYNNSSQHNHGRMVSPMERRRGKVIAAPPAGAECDVENFRVFY